MNPKWIACLGMVFATIHVARSHCAESPGPLNTTALNYLATSFNQFSADFLGIQSNATDGNYVASPLSAAMVLMMAGFGARGATADEISRVLHTQTSRECDIRALIQRLRSYTNVELSLANKIFADNRFDVKSEFLDDTKFVFDSDVKRLNFTQSSDAANVINAWCENQTNSRIKNIMEPGDINDGTDLVLVNAIYFKGKWAQRFDEAWTQDRPFYPASGSMKKVPTMKNIAQYRYGSLPQIFAHFVLLYYESENSANNDAISMFVILPDKSDGFHEVDQHHHEIPLSTLYSGNITEVAISIPKFKIESKIELNDVLKSMGMVESFSHAADFPGISDTKVKIDKAVQKVFIEVNEEGSEAAAASELQVGKLSVPIPEVIFNVNRPFYWLIASKNVVLFSGWVVDIKNQ